MPRQFLHAEDHEDTFRGDEDAACQSDEKRARFGDSKKGQELDVGEV